MSRKKKRGFPGIFLLGMAAMALLAFLGNKAIVHTSSDEYCASCHVHPHSTQSWKRSTHFDNKNGIQVHCVECHLPPHGEGYLVEKAKTGIRDIWSNTFKDPESFNWEAKSQIEYAKKHSYESSCIHCHQNIYPLGLSKDGRSAHLYYEEKSEDLHCINCHITVGHYDPSRLHAKNADFGIVESSEPQELYTEAAVVTGFENFTEFIPGSPVSFEMLAITGGTFKMGSPLEEPGRRENEEKPEEVQVKDFFMAQIEVSWDEYMTFFKQTGARGKTADAYLHADEVDGISGPTAPWGAPDQGWGMGKMPAITMSHHAATVYCQWLSEVTGKTYRLPTEAEWEYAARAKTSTPYFFEGDPNKYMNKGLRNKLFGADTSTIASYVNYEGKGVARPVSPDQIRPNPFGLKHMLGNVSEFCSDPYPGAPEGEFVIRGGSFRSDASGVRSASREATESTAWLKTDPQMPKSTWWFSDCMHVGFRVVCEYEE